MKNTKHQTPAFAGELRPGKPTTRKAPSSNRQGRAIALGAWGLGFLWSFVFGFWCLHPH